MRVISMVPSWTETLIECGVEVIGRTRYCIYPTEKVNDIPIVGGTKDANYSKINSLPADLMILDQEENPKLMSEKIRIPWFASHIEKAQDLPETLRQLSERLQNKNLLRLAERWEKIILQASLLEAHHSSPPELKNLPGILQWWCSPESLNSEQPFTYVIWKNPWMAVSRQTFIGSMFNLLGYSQRQLDFSEKYAQFSWQQIPQNTLVLFSSEPYAFAQEKSELVRLGYPCALVDGESWSWFGVRSLRFLERQFNID